MTWMWPRLLAAVLLSMPEDATATAHGSFARGAYSMFAKTMNKPAQPTDGDFGAGPSGRRLETAAEVKQKLDLNSDGYIQADECLCGVNDDLFEIPDVKKEDVDYGRLKQFEAAAISLAAAASAVDGDIAPKDLVKTLMNMLWQNPRYILGTWFGFMPDAYGVDFNRSYNMSDSAVRVDFKGCAYDGACDYTNEHPQEELTNLYFPQLGRNATLHFPYIYAKGCCNPVSYGDYLGTSEWAWMWNYVSEDVDNFGFFNIPIHDYLHGDKTWLEAGQWSAPYTDPVAGVMVSYTVPIVTRVPISGSFDPFVVSRTGGPATEPMKSWEGFYVMGAVGLDVRLNDIILACDAGKYSNYPVCSNCSNGTARDLSQPAEFCPACEPGHYQMNQGQAECLRCPKGHYASESGQLSCDRCSIGRIAEDRGMSECASCPVGRFLQRDPSGDAAADSCEDCPPGKVVLADGSGCTNCTAGRYNAQSGAAECLDCAPGSADAGLGVTSCGRCFAGTYANSSRQTVCWSCRNLTTTLQRMAIDGQLKIVNVEGAESEELCVCKPGTRPDAVGGCMSCEEGLTCHGGDDVQVNPGFFSSAEISVFQCHQHGYRCPGGPPGQTCAEGRVAISCAECDTGLVEGKAGKCTACRPGSTIPMFFVLVIGFGVLALVYRVIDTQDHTKTSHGVLVFVMCFSTLVTTLQQTTVVGSFNVEYPGPLATMLDATRLFAFDLEVLQVGCLVPQSPMSMFILRITMIVDIIVIFAAFHVAFVVARRWNSPEPTSFMQRLRSGFRERWPVLLAVIGTSFTSFYISVVSLIFGPLQCLPNPNGSWTMRLYPSIICWSTSEHIAMVVIAVLASSIPITYMAICIYAVWAFPRKVRSGDMAFFKAFAFLFFRYSASYYWFALVHMSRSIVLAVIPILPKPALQILLMQVTMLSAVICAVKYQPWRVKLANWVEVLFSVVLFLLICVSSFFVTDDAADAAAYMSMLSCVCSTILVIGLAIFGLVTHLQNKKSRPYRFLISHRKSSTGACARLLKVQLELADVQKGIFLDTDYTQSLDMLFENTGQRTDTLVVLCSADIFMSPASVGEIAVAVHARIPIVKVVFPGYQEPTNDFIELYSKYVPDLQCLTARGLGLAVVQKGLRYVRGDDGQIAKIQLADKLAQNSMASVATTLISGVPGGTVFLPSPGAEEVGSSGIVLLTDRSNMEATATALVLLAFLKPLISDATQQPALLPADAPEIHHTASLVLLVCWNDMFGQISLVKPLLAAAARMMRFLLVIGDTKFTLPTPENLAQSGLKSILPRAANYTEESAVAVLLRMFADVATKFQPSDPDAGKVMLTAQAGEIIQRMQQKSSLKSLGGSLLVPGNDSAYADSAPTIRSIAV